MTSTRRHAYICERCRADVRLTDAEFTERTKRGRVALYCDECLDLRDPPTVGKRDRHANELSIDARRRGGVIATVRDQETGELRTRHEPGYSREAMQALVRWVDALGPSWRICTISTPSSIARDLQGAREREKRSHAGARDEGRDNADVRQTERILLGIVKRLDLLEERPNRYAVYEVPEPGRHARTTHDGSDRKSVV